MADCSAGSNPLAQLNKHTQQDRSLQHTRFNTGSSSQHFKNTQQINDATRFQMESFMSGQMDAPAAHHFGMAPMRAEINRIQQRENSFSPPPQQAVPVFHSSAEKNAWSSEFREAGPTTLASSVQNNQVSPMYRSGMIRSMGMGSSMMMRPMMQQASNQSVKDDVTLSDEKWDEHFKDLEKEFIKETQGPVETEKMEDKEEIIIDDKYKATFDEVWESLHSEETNMDNDFSGQWEKDFQTYASTKAQFGEYKFEENNQFSKNPNAYEIGLILMENGAKLSEAALAFEAAVQENPSHVDAWLKLGEVQTQNEKEHAGISALEKCLELDAGNLSALMALGVGYINEGYDNASFVSLEKWIQHKYPEIAGMPLPNGQDVDRYTLNKRVTAHFLKAATTQGRNDPDVQLGLGILFYANEEFDKTIDCFKAALKVKPDDDILWNRLGASLANSNRSEEAIQAYHHALQLKPSFVRARYNLAVSCINIGCYKEAAEHLLTGLSMHEVDGIPNDVNFNGSASTNILETLKRAFIAMNRRDLLEKVKPGMDLSQFRNEFTF